MDNDEQLQTNTYIWSQSSDQVTITFLVPDSVKAKDLDITFEKQDLKAGLKGQEPVFQAKLYQTINHFESLWQLEKNPMSPFSSLTASPSLSIASSYAFMSPTHSPNSSMILPEAAAGPVSEMSELLAHSGSPALSETDISQPASPSPVQKFRVLTIHLEKEDDTIEWVVPISGFHTKTNTMDITSSYLLAQWFEVRLGNLNKALELYISAAERDHTASMLKVAAIYETDTTHLKNAPEKDSKKAFEWHKRAADCPERDFGTNISSGPDPLACYVIGSFYGSGLLEAGIEKNYQNALFYFNRCMTITAPRIDIDFSLLDQSLTQSQLRNHAPQTRDEKYFCSAAFQTGLVYLYGSHPEGQSELSSTRVDPDPDLAIRYWKEAALLGHAQACFNIGILFANGMGVEKDLWSAGKWFGRAIKLDNSNTLVVPEEVKIVEWDAVKGEEKPEKKRKSKKTKKVKKSTYCNPEDHDVVGAIVALGTIAAVAGVAWFLYMRGKKGQ
ncbi:hypothetical protein CU098_010656 [Rhizopus stolonifer]|uniref:CS domain-containing protein n=1 Tax=Rhizopus stolonifer TaxID=4846 RepID=A0A367KCJ3_RHIST|nr:hypothetical protein CU098_010656 [Rhizopus stolonifer]